MIASNPSVQRPYRAITQISTQADSVAAFVTVLRYTVHLQITIKEQHIIYRASLHNRYE